MTAMMKRATDVEKIVYRFVLSVILGFAIGCHLLPSLHPIAYHVLPRSWCPSPTSDVKDVVLKGLDEVANNDDQIVDRHGVVYIGMMSMEEKLDSRAQAAVNSWARHASKIHLEVFANNNGTYDAEKRLVSSHMENGVRVIQLPGVKDVDYPPQKKSFSMIKFMHDVYLGNYDWFVRLDDDAYVDADKLHKFLSGVNSSIPWFIGSAGFGKDKNDQIRKGENYCMGGPGVIMSRGLLRQLGPNLGACLRTLYTEHEDIELGRCVQKMTGVQCTVSWETKKLFYQNYQQGSYATNIEKIEPTQLDRGLIFHANKDAEKQIKFHSMILKRKIFHLMNRVNSLESELRSLVRDEHSDQDPNTHAQYRWDSVVGRSIFKTDEKNMVRNMIDGLKTQLIDGTNAAVRVIQGLDTPSKTLREVALVQSYHIVNPSFATDSISHILCTYQAKFRGQIVKDKKEEKPIHARQYFINNLVFLEEPSTLTANKNLLSFTDISEKDQKRGKEAKVNFIMALSGRPENFVRFLNNFESAFLTRGESANLYLAYFPAKVEKKQDDGQSDDFVHDTNTVRLRENYNAADDLPIRNSDERFIIENMSALQRAYPNTELNVVFMAPGTDFSRGLGLQTAAKEVASPDEILFFCDVDLVFAPEMLMHIRRNTVQHKQVYYPVFFSQYDPDVVYVEMPKPRTDFHFEELDGFWRHFSYGMVSLYNSDFVNTKGFDLTIQGWGLEDIHMVNSILNAGLQVFKSTEPAEVHIYHDKFCDPSLSGKQYKDCMNSRATHYGPRALLYYLWNTPISPEGAVSNTTNSRAAS